MTAGGRPRGQIVPALKGTHCHFLIAETAKAFAHELYDVCMTDNTQWKQWKERCPELTRDGLEAEFVRLLWPKLIEQARATLARLLGQTTNEVLQKQIHEALVLDNTLRRGRNKHPGYRLGLPPTMQ